MAGASNMSSEEDLVGLADVLNEVGLAEADEAHREEAAAAPEGDGYDKFDIGRVDIQLLSRGILALGPRHIVLRDKLAFLAGATSWWVCAFWMGAQPHSFYRLYTGLGLILFAVRYTVYRARRWHYYLLDLCYFCNALLLVHLYAAPRSRLLAHVTFAFNTGPLAASILAFRNSLVFHDLDKVTSLFLHLVPACVSWCTRWHTDTVRFGDDVYAHTPSPGFVQLVLMPCGFYVVWATLYWHTIFVFAAERIRRRNYVTLFTYVTSQQRGVFHAIARRVPTRWQPPVYLFLHLCFCATTMMLAVLAWRSFLVHTVLLISVTTLSVYHGASYYFEVFAMRYHAGLAPPRSPRTAPPRSPHATATAGDRVSRSKVA